MATTLTARYEVPAQPEQALCPNVRNRVGVGHALIDDCSFDQACESIVEHARRGGRPSFVTTANAQHIVLLETDKRLREIYNHADLIVADGHSLLLAARIAGHPLRERVTGVDTFQTLCALAAKHGLHVFLLGGRPDAANRAAEALKKRSPSLRVSTYCPPIGFEKTPQGLSETAQAIRAAKPDMLFVALGAPKQEYWIHDHGLHLAVPILMGVGGTFEMVAGIVGRAPRWMQRTGLEWLYRLCVEPRRMWRRYLIGNLVFAGIVARQVARRKMVEKVLRCARDGRFAAELREPRITADIRRFASDVASDPQPTNDPAHEDAVLV